LRTFLFQKRPLKFPRGCVVGVKTPNGKLRFAAVLEDAEFQRGPHFDPSKSKLSVHFLEEVMPLEGFPTRHGVGDAQHFILGRGKRSGVSLDRVVARNGRYQTIFWEEGDIWDQLHGGQYRSVPVGEYNADVGRVPFGVKSRFFLLPAETFELYRAEAGCETRKVEKRPLMWGINPIDEIAMKKPKLA